VSQQIRRPHSPVIKRPVKKLGKNIQINWRGQNLRFVVAVIFAISLFFWYEFVSDPIAFLSFLTDASRA
jgi:hypothetical protein